MNITKDLLEKRLQLLISEKNQIANSVESGKTALQAYDGAIQDVNYWITVADSAEETALVVSDDSVS